MHKLSPGHMENIMNHDKAWFIPEMQVKKKKAHDHLIHG